MAKPDLVVNLAGFVIEQPILAKNCHVITTFDALLIVSLLLRFNYLLREKHCRVFTSIDKEASLPNLTYYHRPNVRLIFADPDPNIQT
jgi:hypothetical protein